ncbi:hypothetical protein GCM10009838_68860 [Catenulispora subtropica]|uniref:Uncharacterized protein n=1 Tax=Catenulispora subtropica TaxID=450798 RepID=A0ABP5EC97_9ACTN
MAAATAGPDANGVALEEAPCGTANHAAAKTAIPAAPHGTHQLARLYPDTRPPTPPPVAPLLLTLTV